MKFHKVHGFFHIKRALWPTYQNRMYNQLLFQATIWQALIFRGSHEARFTRPGQIC